MSANDNRTPGEDTQLVREVMGRMLVSAPMLQEEDPQKQPARNAAAGGTVEVSPRMVKAGESVLFEQSEALMPRDLVKEIYLAMERARADSSS